MFKQSTLWYIFICLGLLSRIVQTIPSISYIQLCFLALMLIASILLEGQRRINLTYNI